MTDLVHFKNMVMTMNKQNHFSNSDTTINKTINTEQFSQLVEAILAGKYSWACVLILRFTGYNPLLYIPYRTYNRLQKENDQISRPSRHDTDSTKSVEEFSVMNPDDKSSHNYLSRKTTVSYLDRFASKTHK